MSDLVNRHNIVDRFYNSMPVLSLSKDTTEDVIIFSVPDLLEIRRYPKENIYSFAMYIRGTFEEQEYDENYRHFNPSSNGMRTITRTVYNLVEVMQYDNGHFRMISTSSNDKWIDFVRSLVAIPGGGASPRENLVTHLNMSFKKLPLTEDYHFQRSTTDGLVLELEYCLKVQEIIDFIDSIGSVIVVNERNNLKVPLFFTERLGKGG